MAALRFLGLICTDDASNEHMQGFTFHMQMVSVIYPEAA